MCINGQPGRLGDQRFQVGGRHSDYIPIRLRRPVGGQVEHLVLLAVGLTGLIDEHGQADWGGLIYHLADPEEAWVIETTTRNWVARRVRDDEIHVTANRFRIGADYDLASDTLVGDAMAAGWLDATAEKL